MEPAEIGSLEELRECYAIMLGTARRCARDLRHAIDNVPQEHPLRDHMRERYENYRTIFADLAEYRIRLHQEINDLAYKNDRLTSENERLRRQCGEKDPIFDAEPWLPEEVTRSEA